MTARSRPIALLAALSILAVAVTGCIPVPIPHWAQVTPRVVGTLNRDDGRPIAGAAVGITPDHEDRTCSRSGVRDTTDAEGRFQLPVVKERRRVFWLTMIENFGLTGYWVCARPADSLPGVTEVIRSSVDGHLEGDSLLCLRWEERDGRRLVCESSTRRHRVVEGGRWADGGASGYYRLLIADADDIGYSSHLAVQWVDSSAATLVARVVAVAESPAGEPVQSWPAPKLLLRGGRWYATATAERLSKWGNRREVVLELGPPGVARPLTDSESKRFLEGPP